jgi:hypothetical protein
VKLGVHENVPDVFEAFGVNVLPVVAGEEAAVNEAIGGPSGSAADTVKVISVFSFPEAVAGAVAVGATSAAGAAAIPSLSKKSEPSLYVLSKSLPEHGVPNDEKFGPRLPSARYWILGVPACPVIVTVNIRFRPPASDVAVARHAVISVELDMKSTPTPTHTILKLACWLTKLVNETVPLTAWRFMA